MRNHSLMLVVALSGAIFLFSQVQAAGCPCSPCKCLPCTCGGGHSGGGGGKGKEGGGGGKGKEGGGGGKSKQGGGGGGKHAGKGGGHHKGGHHGGHSSSSTSIGVGINVDLSGIGRRQAEPDPFAAGGEPQPVAKTPDKPRTMTKTKEPGSKTTGFEQIRLTGREAKGDTKPMDTKPVDTSDAIDQLEAPALKPPTGPATLDGLKGAQADYKDARNKFLQADQNYQKAIDEFQNGNSSKLGKLIDQFNQTDEGKKLLDKWMKTYRELVKAGEKIPDPLVPPDKFEQAKHELTTAQDNLKSAQNDFDAGKSDAVSKHNGVKNIQAAIDELKKKPHFSENEAKADRDKLKQLEADLDKAKKQVEKDWASSDQGKKAGKAVQSAEQQLEKAKSDFKPFEDLEQNATKAAANP